MYITEFCLIWIGVEQAQIKVSGPLLSTHIYYPTCRSDLVFLWDKMTHLHAVSVCHIEPETSMSTLCLDIQVHIWKSIQIMSWLVLSLWNLCVACRVLNRVGRCLQNGNISMSTVKHRYGKWHVSVYEVVWPLRVADQLSTEVSCCTDGNLKLVYPPSFHKHQQPLRYGNS